MNAHVNATQVGGSHYQSEFQHWDFVLLVLQGRYLEGCITKYVTRHHKKNGRQDLEKARHYLVKLKDSQRCYAPLGWMLTHSKHLREFVTEQVTAFTAMNQLGELETLVLSRISTWRGIGDLEAVEALIERLLDTHYAPLPPS